MTDDSLRRLHRALVEELDRRGHAPDRPLKVAELYEDLVPYRVARSVLDVHVRADYEHALLRLLAGEDSLVRIEPDEAREELRREVDAPYPDVALYRKFAASDAFVSRAPAADTDEPGPPEEPGHPEGDGEDEMPPTPHDEDGGVEAGPVEAGAVEAGPVEAGPVEAGAVETGAVGAGRNPAEGAGATGGDCIFCGRALPADRVTRFCPLCGGDQRLEPCARCGEPLESTWRFCIACGQETAEG